MRSNSYSRKTESAKNAFSPLAHSGKVVIKSTRLVILKATFSKLNDILDNFVHNNVPAVTGMADKLFQLTCNQFCYFVKETDIIPMLSGFNELLKKFKYDDDIILLVLKGFDCFAISAMKHVNNYNLAFDTKLLISLLEILISKKSTGSTNMVLAIYNPEISVNIPMSLAFMNDEYVEHVIFLLSMIDKKAFLNIYKLRLLSFIKAAPIEYVKKDILFLISDSKIMCGYLEIITYAKIDIADLLQELHSLSQPLRASGKNVSRLLKVLGYFYATAIKNWLILNPEKYISYANKLRNFDHIFVNWYSMSPEVTFLNYRPIAVYLLCNPRLLDDFKYADTSNITNHKYNDLPLSQKPNNNKESSSKISFNPLELKICSRLKLLVTENPNLLIDEKYLILEIYSNLLTCAHVISKYDKSHSLVKFCIKYAKEIFANIKDVCFIHDGSRKVVLIIELSKIDLLAYGLNIVPELFAPLLKYYVDNYEVVSSYEYYMALCAIDKADTDVAIQHILDKSSYQRIIAKLNTLNPVIKETKANLSILSFEGYISRHTFQLGIRIFAKDPIGFFSSFSWFFSDSVLTKDHVFYKTKLTDTKDFSIYIDMIYCYLRGSDSSCYKEIIDFSTAILKNSELVNYSHFIFAFGIEVLARWYSSIIDQGLNSLLSNKYIFIHFATVIQLFEKLIKLVRRVDTFGFDDVNSVMSRAIMDLAAAKEQFLIIFLCITNPEYYSIVKKDYLMFWNFVYTLPVIKERLTEDFNIKFTEIIINDSEVLVKGQKFFRNKVRSFFKLGIEKPSKGVLLATDIIKDLIKPFLKDPDSASKSKSQMNSFGNYASFLVSTLGVDFPPNVCSLDYMEISQMPKFKLISEILDVLSKTKKMEIKIMIIDTITNDISPNLAFNVYLIFIEKLEKLVKLNRSELLSLEQIDFLQSYLHIVTGFFDRLGEFLFENSARIVAIINYLLELLKNQYLLLNRGNRNSTDAIVIEIAKFKLLTVKFVGTCLKYHEYTRINNTFVLWKNDLLKLLFHWLESSFFKYEINNVLPNSIDGIGFQSVSDRNIISLFNIYRELVLEIMVALTHLTNDLSIVQKNINFNEEVNTFRTIMFGNYYNVLIRILKKTIKDNKSKNLNTENSQQSLSQVVSSAKSYRPQEYQEANLDFTNLEFDKIVQNINLTLGNMVKSNWDVAASNVLPLVTDNDPTIKKCLLQLIKHTFFKQTEDLKTENFFCSDSFYELCFEALKHTHFIIAISMIASPSEIDILAQAILSITEAGGIFLYCMKLLLDHELKFSSNHLGILRNNNLTSKILSSIGKKYSQEYLRSTTGNILDELIANDENFEMVISQDLIISQELTDRFTEYFKKLVYSICDSLEAVPSILKATCYLLRNRVFAFTKNDKLSLKIVGTYFFLRFLCPAIAFPDDQGFLTLRSTYKSSRGFVLLSKALQNLSNGTLNTERFPLLKGKEKEIFTLQSKIETFIDKLSSEDLVEQIENETHTLRKFDMIYIRVIYTFIVNNVEKLRNINLRFGVDNARGGKYKDSFYAYRKGVLLFEKINFTNFNFYPTVADFIRNNRRKYLELYDIINKSLEDPVTEQIMDSKFLYESVAKDGSQVFALTYSKFLSLDVNPKLLFARIIQSLARASTSTYYIVIDCTLYNKPNLTPVLQGTVDLLNRLTPEEIADKCIGVFYINVCSIFASELVKQVNEKSKSDGKLLNPNYCKTSFLSSFENSCIIESFNLYPWTYNFGSNNKVFTDVLYYPENSLKGKPAQIRIDNCFVVYSIGDYENFKVGNISKKIKLINYEPLNDWKYMRELDDDVCKGIEDSKKHSFFEAESLMMQQKLVFESNSKFQIISMFILKRTDYKTNLYNQTAQISINSNTVHKKRLLGEFFFAIGLGLISNEIEIRKNAYELSHIFQNYVDGLYDHDVYILDSVSDPPKSIEYLSTFSSKLALKYPELTKEIITVFIFISKYMISSSLLFEDTYGIYALLEPWIDLVYSQIYTKTEDSFNGPELVRSFISSILKSVPAEQTHILGLHYNVMSKFINESQYVSIVMEEVVKEVSTRRVSGQDYKNLLSLLGMNSTMKLCNAVMEKLVEGTGLTQSIETQAVMNDLYWFKIEFLLELWIPMFFNKILYVEKYLPEILFICASFHRTGPPRVRLLIQNITINTFSAFQNNKLLTQDSKNLISEKIDLLIEERKKIKHLKSHNMVASTLSDLAKDYWNNIFSNETQSKALVCLLSLDEYQARMFSRVWFSRLLDLTVEVALNDDSVFQNKNIQFIGHLNKLGTNDYLIAYYLQLSGDKLFEKPVFNTILAFLRSLGEIVKGLSLHSPFFQRFIFLAMITSLYDNVLVFETSVFVFSETVKLMFQNNVFTDESLLNVLAGFSEQKCALFNKYFSDMPRLFIQDIDKYLLVVIGKSLYTSRARSAAYHLALSIITVRVSVARKYSMKYNATFDLGALSVLVPFFMVINNSDEFLAIFENAGFESDKLKMVNLGNGYSVCEILIQSILLWSDMSKLSLILSSYLFGSKDLDLIWKNKYLNLLFYIGKINREIIDFTFPIIRDECLKLCEDESTKDDLLVSVNNILQLATTTTHTGDKELFQIFLENTNTDLQLALWELANNDILVDSSFHNCFKLVLQLESKITNSVFY